MRLERYLDNIEINVMGFAPSATVEYLGTIDEQSIAFAFELLCARYPVLRTRIRPENDRYVLYVAHDFHPELRVVDGDEDTLRSEAVSRSWDPQDAVARLILIRGQARGFVALRLDHAIVNGGNMLSIFKDLWRLYTDIVNGSRIPMGSSVSLPRAPTELLKERVGDISFASALDSSGVPQTLAVCDAIERRIRLNREETARLIATSRAHKTSVHALVCGSTIVSLRAQGTSTLPAPMVCWSPIDLRNRVTPPLSTNESTTGFSLRHRAHLTVSATADPIEIGREVKGQIERYLAKGKFFREPVYSPPTPFDTPLEAHLATVSVSNNGIIPEFSTPPNLMINDFLIPSYPKTVLYPTYSFYTHNGRLSIRIVYPSDLFSDTEIDQLVKRTTGHLIDIGNRKSAPSRESI